MLSFSLHLLTESIRVGLPHIHSMDHKQFSGLMHKEHIDLSHITEKSDGMTHKMGYDEHGFFTQSSGSGSEKMRHPKDFEERATRRARETGKPLDLTAAHAFGHIHQTLQNNQKLQSYLKKKANKEGGETHIRGEVFYKPLAKDSPHHGEKKFVGTSYRTDHMGSVGKYVIHTKLPENQKHDVEHLKTLSTHEMNFDDDKLHSSSGHKTSVDVSSEHKAFKKLDHGLLAARTTPKNKAEKEHELGRMHEIQKRVSKKVDAHMKKMGLRPKWGSESEGIVVHPTDEHTPRFKVTSDSFRAYRDKRAAEGKKSMNEAFHNFATALGNILLEGGNAKTASGEKAEPLHAKDREFHQKEIHHALSHLHDSFHQEHSENLFGKGKKALHSGSAYSGSSKHLMSKNISNEEFAKHKPTSGDIDTQIPSHLKDKLAEHLNKHKQFGNYHVEAVHKHGTEISAVMKHQQTGHRHQIDFEGVRYHHDEPEKSEGFLHSSDWEDTKHGIKGAHHKMLLNAAGGATHKFSIVNGLQSREDKEDKGVREPEHVAKKLFGDKADASKIHSFLGTADLIKKHLSPSQHQQIVDKFAESVKSKKNIDHSHALEHLSRVLGKKPGGSSLNEAERLLDEGEASEEEHHVSAIPLVGFSPISHMGHAHDLGGSLKKLPGKKHIGISKKADVFSPEERKHILHKQWNSEGTKTPVHVHLAGSAGETVRHAYDSIKDKKGKKVLHLLVGHDRKDFAHNLKKSLEAGKISEMEGHKFDEIHVHHPEDSERSHGMSGTNMRAAAHSGDFETFHKHLGHAFSKDEAHKVMAKVKEGIDSKKIKLKRSG